MKYIESFVYEGYTYEIYEDGRGYYAKCLNNQAYNTHGETIVSLKMTDIPIRYDQNKNFRL
ncbi:hypothetical protein [Clostridium saccharoperbutylacetonicum]|uniref:hypothetical protein n=1 Tax=Clostridium saccharoperbutylacetonicum TaxID=36745 RepID=UPI0039E730D1